MAGIEIIDQRYRRLHERVVDVLGRDHRVLRVEVSGSVAADTADEWSDLDLAIVIRPDDHAAFLAEWPTWLAEITSTVYARTPVAPFIINAVTDDGLTLDLAVWSGEVPRFPAPTPYPVGLPGARFDSIGAALEFAVAEQLRGLTGPFISLVRRGEHVRHLAGVPHLLGLLTAVFLAETGRPPFGKHWNESLTEEQRAAVAALPAVRATSEAIVAFGLGVAELLLTRARPLFPRYGLAWPSLLAAVAADRIRVCLGTETADWLS